MSLELAVSQALMKTRALERALHDSGPWRIELDGARAHVIMTASRQVTPSSVVFTIGLAARGMGICVATLHCRNDPVLVREIDLSDVTDPNIAVDWELRLSDAVTA